MILKCVCSSFFSSPPASRPIGSPNASLSFTCVRTLRVEEKKKILAPRTTRHPRREKTDDETDDETDDDMGGGEDQAKRETSTTPRNDSDSVGSSSPPTNTNNVNTNTNANDEKLQIVDARLGLLEEDVADLQTSHDVLTTLIVAAPIVLTAVLYCARLFSASLSISGRKND